MLIKSIMWDTNNDNEALASLPDEIEFYIRKTTRRWMTSLRPSLNG